MEQKFDLPDLRALVLRPEDLDTLLALGDGECALLYLYLLRSGGVLNADAGRLLGRSEAAVSAAAEKLRRAGLLGPAPAPAAPADVLPQYTAEDIYARAAADPAFSALQSETRARLGHDLSTEDLRTLFGIYDRLGLPCAVIMLLINYVADSVRRRYGEGRLPTMRAIEKEAFRWCDQEIMTVEAAETFLARAEEREKRASSLRSLLQITGREPTATERRYIDRWTAMNFPPESLELAYDRTVVGTGKLTWSYMDKILASWQEKGLYTPEEIAKGDAPPRRRRPEGKKAGPAPAAPVSTGDLSALENILNSSR